MGIRKFGKEVLGLATFEGAKYVVFAVCSFAIAKLGTVLASHYSSLAPYAWLVFASLFTGVLSFLVITNTKFGKHRPQFPSLDCDFHIRHKTITYEYKSASEIVYRRQLILVALKNNLDRYPDKYHWTGRHVTKVSVVDKEQSIVLTERKNVWQLFEIRFPKVYHKGDVVNAEITWRLDDKEGLAVPFVSATVYEPTDKLTFNVTFDKSLGVSQIVCEYSPDIGAKKEFKSNVKALDPHGAATWEIENPELMHYYEVRWNPHQGDNE